MKVPLYGVRMPASVGQELSAVLSSGRLASGPKVDDFEGGLRSYLDNPLVVSTADLSSSIAMSLYLAGVRPDDEVICSPMVCLATSMPINTLFARTRWCDVDPMTGNMDPDALAEVISDRSKAVLVFHYGGNPADMERICRVATSVGAAVIDDASEAFGAELDGRKLGSTGSDFTCFSFYANKQLNTGADGGAIAFRDIELFERGRWARRFGIHQPSFRLPDGEINPDSDVAEAGWASSMTNLAAAIGVENFRDVDAIVRLHQETAAFYGQELRNVDGLMLLAHPKGARPSPWVYTLLADRRDDLMRRLNGAGIQASRVHLRNDRYSCFRAEKCALPGVDKFASRALSIPCGWWVSPEQREYVVETIKGGW